MKIKGKFENTKEKLKLSNMRSMRQILPRLMKKIKEFTPQLGI